jgi:hypothetical protein
MAGEDVIISNVQGSDGVASEVTLKQLLAAMQIVAAKSVKEFKNGEQLDKALKDLAKKTKDAANAGKKFEQSNLRSYKAQQKNTDAVEESTDAFKQAASKLSSIKSAISAVTTAITAPIRILAEVANTVQNLDGSLSGAGAAMQKLPGAMGEVFAAFGPTLAALDKTHTAFSEAASVGANFGGNMNDLVNSAGGMGMRFEELSGIIKNNGENLMLLGGSTAEGAKRFATLGKEIRKSPVTADLARLGMTTTQINDGFLKYTADLQRSGRLEGKTNEELIALSGDYMKNLDAVSKLTGKSKEAMQAEQDALMADAQFRMMRTKLDAKGQVELDAFIKTLPKSMQAGAKEVLATGTATSKAGEDFLAFMQKSGTAAQQTFQEMRSTGTFTADQSKRLYGTIAAESKQLAGSPLGETLSLFDPAMNEFMVGVMDVGARTKTFADVVDANAKQIKDSQVTPPAVDPAKVVQSQQMIADAATQMVAKLNAIDITPFMDKFKMAADLAIATAPVGLNAVAENFDIVAVAATGLTIAAGLASVALTALSYAAGKQLLMGKGKGMTGGGRGTGGAVKGTAKAVGKQALRGVPVIGTALGVGMSVMEGVSAYGAANEKLKAGEITQNQATTEKSQAVGEATGGAGGAVAGALAGAAMGSVVPVIGTAIGGVIGAAVGYWGGSAAGKKLGSVVGDTLGGPDTIRDLEAKAAKLNAAIADNSFGSVGFSAADEKKELAAIQKQIETLKAKQSTGTGTPASTANATAQDAQRQLEAKVEADRQKAEADKQKKEADKKAAEEAKKKAEAAKASTTQTKKTPEEVMMALNTHMEELVRLTNMTNMLMNRQIGATTGLSSDSFIV